MGRQKEFDERLVLDKAMKVFWENGYEKTSFQNLVEEMKIHRRSIYDTFGDKHALFIQSLDLYSETIYKEIIAKFNHNMSAYERLEIIFTNVVMIETDYPAGCLVVNTATELSGKDKEVSEKIEVFFGREEQQIYDILLEGQKNNELSEEKDIQVLAYYLHNALIGLRVLAKTTNDKEKLKVIIKENLSIIG